MSKISRENSHQRQKPSKTINYKVVIVCEDTINSVEYFQALCQEMRLWKVKVAVDGESHPQPSKVYEYVQKNYSRPLANITNWSAKKQVFRLSFMTFARVLIIHLKIKQRLP